MVMYNLKGKTDVYFRGMHLNGGAPRSAFEYLSVLKKDGHGVTVIAYEKDKKLTELYKNSFDNFVHARYMYDYFEKKDFIGLYRLLNKEYRMLKKNRPGLVVVLGHFTAYFYSCFCNSLGIPAVVIIAGGDLSDGIHLLEGCPCDHVICFSVENREVLLRCIDNERITVIPNRIKLKTTFCDTENHYKTAANSCVNILFTSRLNSDKYDSVTRFIEIVNKVANKNRRINLAVAGDGDLIDNLKEFVASTVNPYLNVDIKGHVDNLIPEFEKAHIVVGKGRSVIEPIMMNRIGCVMGNDGKIEVCTTDNFEHLYHYNFSGRNLKCDNPEAVLKELIDSVMSGTFDTEKMKAAAEITRKYYSSEYLADKFHYVLENMTCEKRRKKRVSVLWLIIKLVWIKLFDKIRKGKEK